VLFYDVTRIRFPGIKSLVTPLDVRPVDITTSTIFDITC